jgi:hypothetical protein
VLVKVAGIAPNGLALSTDGMTLYLACGGINAVTVIRTADAQVEGLIPTGWYPNDLRLSPDGKFLAVANLMGVGPGGSAPFSVDLDDEKKEERNEAKQPSPNRETPGRRESVGGDGRSRRVASLRIISCLRETKLCIMRRRMRGTQSG